MSRSARSPFTSSRAPDANQPAFPYPQGVSVAAGAAFPESANFSTGLQLPCDGFSLDMIDQYHLHNDLDLSFNHLGLSGPEAASLLSFQPPFSYVSPDSHDPVVSGLLTASLDSDQFQYPEFPSSPVFPGLQENVQAKSERRLPRNRKPQTPSPTLRSRRRMNHVAAQLHSPSPSSPSHAPSPYFTSPTDSAALVSPRLSLYAPIAPRPDESMVITPATEDEDPPAVSSSKRRRKPPPPPSPSSTASSPPDGERLSAADELLVRLREDESLPWKEVAARFRAETGRDFSVAALQMRLKRLRERVRPWTDRDVLALRMAHDYWISHKFEIIAAKMMDFGLTEAWSGRQCARKLHQMGFPTSPIQERATNVTA